MSDAFRQEIIENQNARVDLIKWKLIIVAAIFAWSLKNATTSQQLSFWAISLVPFVCLFVDSQCFHINLRTLVIGQFRRKKKAEAREENKPDSNDQLEYEEFVHKLRVDGGLKNIFELEQGVLTISTFFLCFCVFAWPIVAAFSLHLPLPALNEYGAYACLVFGVLGFIFSGLLTRRYEELKSKLMKYEYSVPKKD